MLDEQHSMAFAYQLRMEDLDKFFHVVNVKAGGRLVENIEGGHDLAGALLLVKSRGDLEALAFAAAKRDTLWPSWR